MANYSDIKEVRILNNPDEVNKLLDNWWRLLRVRESSFGIGFLFVLGRGLDEESKNLLDSYKCEGAE